MRGRPARGTHGTYAYARKHKCKCEPCLTASRRYRKQLGLDQARQTSRRIDAEPVRAHVQRLLDAGLALHQIGNAAEPKVFRSVLVNIMGEAKFVHRTTAERILAVTYAQAAGVDRLVPAIGLHRRIQALEYMGHSKVAIGKALGQFADGSAIYNYMGNDVCMSSTITEVQKVYEKLSMIPGENVRVMWAARRRGWMPPMAWDDETIDDPNTQPHPVVCIVGRCSRTAFKASLCKTHYYEVSERGGFAQGRNYKPQVERLDRLHRNDRERMLHDLADLREQGYTPERAAMRLDRSESYVKRMWGETA